MRSLLYSAALFATALVQARGDDADAEKKAIAKIRESGALVLEIAQNDNRLDVSYITAQGKITNEQLAPLKDLKRLAHLNLRGLEIGDDALPYLAKQETLVKLHLEKTKVTDKGLEQLKGLQNLEYLNLYGTEIGDAGLEHLAGLKKLKSLYLWQTKVTDEGVKKLQAALPELKIDRGT
jgi:Leucine-rich repeat (LRR) protein